MERGYNKRVMMKNAHYTAALTLAIEIHGEKDRKGTDKTQQRPTPYVSHLVAVSELVLRYGGDEEQAIAALLHDAIEDGEAEAEWERVIGERFGERVRRIVRGCTDGEPDARGEKAPWRERKERYIAHLRAEPEPDTLLVSAADKLHNLSSIRLDLAEYGMSVFDRFSATPEDTLWYYRELIAIFAAQGVHAGLMARLKADYAACEERVRP
jgi:(p)ppGpp synthase/HD superfamily hydrolase